MLLTIPVKAEFRVIDLGTLKGDATSSAAAINDFGEIVGESVDSNRIPHAFSYQNGRISDLSTNPSTAAAINNAGQIVGSILTFSTNIEVFSPPSTPIAPTNRPRPFTNIVILPTNPVIVLTNPVIEPITPVVPFTNPVVVLTNPVFVLTNPVFLPTNIVFLPTNILIPLTNPLILPTNIIIVANPSPDDLPPLTNTAVNPAASMAAVDGITMAGPGQPGVPIPLTNGEIMTNVVISSQPVLFRRGLSADLFEGTNSGFASGINNRGEIVGAVVKDDLTQYAFAYKNGLTTDLPALSSDTVPTEATCVNNSGDIAGVAENEPFLYRHGLMRDLGTLGGTAAGATAINDLDEIVGWSTITSNAEIHAFLYRQGRMRDLGTLEGAPSSPGTNLLGPLPPIGSWAYAINNWGQIVGASTAANGSHAFVYSDGTMTDLNDLVALTHTNGPAGFLVLTVARGINDCEQIVGTGAYWDGARETTRAFLVDWRPEQEPDAARGDAGSAEQEAEPTSVGLRY